MNFIQEKNPNVTSGVSTSRRLLCKAGALTALPLITDSY